MPSPKISVCLAACVLLTTCTTVVRGPDFGTIYNRAAQYHGPERNPVVVIPGVLGSRLVDGESGKLVWGAFSGGWANPSRAEGARLVALPMAEGRELTELRDEVISDGALDRLRIRLFGLPIGLNAYAYILAALGVGGYRDQALGESGAVEYADDHYTCFQYDYDWRRDIVENARRLHAFLESRRAYVEAQNCERFGASGAPVRFDVVAHSMGGLVLRYFLRYGTADLPADGSLPELTWAGAEYVERAILVGPPNAGSALALEDLVCGEKMAFFIPRYSPAVLGTMPALYQLLPRPRHGVLVAEGAGDDHPAAGGAGPDHFDPETWRELGWGLAAPDQDRILRWLLPDVPDAVARRRIALDHQAKCLERARRFAAAMDRPGSPPDGLGLYLVAGDAESTPQAVAVEPSTGDVRMASHGPGDGTVLRQSALLDERSGQEWRLRVDSPIDWTQVIFLTADHLDLTRIPAFTDNVLYLLLEEPRTP
jgi:hypothetical protein